MPNIPSMKDLLKAGVHFGHRTSRWHPRMEEFIHSSRNGVHVIDLAKTQVQLEKALQKIENIVAGGGSVMFIGTKIQYQDIISKYATEAGMPYVNNRWLGGTFTNFSEIQKLIKNYLDLKDKRTKGELKKYTKLEQLQFDRRIEDLESKIGGISIITKLPEAVFVVDMRHDKTAVMESRQKGVKVIGLCDTNVNPAYADIAIPANDDSIASATMMLKLVSEAVKIGKARAKGNVAKRHNEKRPDSKSPQLDLDKKEIIEKDEELAVTQDSKESVEALDDAIKDELAREKEDKKK